MYYTTGFSRDEIVDLCAMINTLPVESRESWPPILGLFKAVVIALTYMRRNRVQCELAETYGVSQSTISRAITVLTQHPSQQDPLCHRTDDRQLQDLANPAH